MDETGSKKKKKIIKMTEQLDIYKFDIYKVDFV